MEKMMFVHELLLRISFFYFFFSYFFFFSISSLFSISSSFSIFSFLSLLPYEDCLRSLCRCYLPKRVFADLPDFPRCKTSCCMTARTCQCAKYMQLVRIKYTQDDSLHIKFLITDFCERYFIPDIDRALLPEIDGMRRMIDDQSRCIA